MSDSKSFTVASRPFLPANEHRPLRIEQKIVEFEERRRYTCNTRKSLAGLLAKGHTLVKDQLRKGVVP
jgi:hypothetical protein